MGSSSGDGSASSGDSLANGVGEAPEDKVGDTVDGMDGDALKDKDTVADAVIEGVTEGDTEEVAVIEGEAPKDKDGVGEMDTECDGVGIGSGVGSLEAGASPPRPSSSSSSISSSSPIPSLSDGPGGGVTVGGTSGSVAVGTNDTEGVDVTLVDGRAHRFSPTASTGMESQLTQIKSSELDGRPHRWPSSQSAPLPQLTRSFGSSGAQKQKLPSVKGHGLKDAKSSPTVRHTSPSRGHPSGVEHRSNCATPHEKRANNRIKQCRYLAMLDRTK